MKKLLSLMTLCLLMLTATPQQKLTNLNGWNCYVHTPADYAESGKSYPAVIFFPGAGELGTDASKLIAHGPGAYLKSGWTGQALGIDFIIISIQPIPDYPSLSDLTSRINLVKEQYRISEIWLTGLSRGAANSLGLSFSYLNDFKGVIAVEPQPNWKTYPDHPNTYDYYTEDVLRTYTEVARAGQQYFIFHNQGGLSRANEIYDGMQLGKPGSADYAERAFNGGGHTGWDQVYGTATTEPYRFSEIANKNIYEWIADKILQVLPDFITSFTHRGGQLTWTCENIDPGDYFIIEESADGKSFTQIGRVDAAPFKTSYTFSL